jgi:hypothetical protein
MPGGHRKVFGHKISPLHDSLLEDDELHVERSERRHELQEAHERSAIAGRTMGHVQAAGTKGHGSSEGPPRKRKRYGRLAHADKRDGSTHGGTVIHHGG